MIGVKDGSKFASYNPILRYIHDKIEDELIKTNTIIPAIVHSYNEKTNRAEIIPIFSVNHKRKGSLTIPPLPDVMVAHYGSEKSSSYFSKLNQGDAGLLFISQRALTEFKQKIENGELPVQHSPKNLRRHNISDGLFMPMNFRPNASNGIIANNLSTLAFENQATSLKAIIDDLTDQVSRLKNQVTSMDVAITTSITTMNAIPVVGQGLFAAWSPYIAASTTIKLQLIRITASLTALKLKTKGLLKDKGGVLGLLSNIL